MQLQNNCITFLPSHLFDEGESIHCRVHSIFKNVLNILVREEIFSISSRLSPSRHHIVVKNPINFNDHITMQSSIELTPSWISLGDLKIKVESHAKRLIPPFNRLFSVDDVDKALLEELEDMLYTERTSSVFSFDPNDDLTKKIEETIERFLKDPSEPNVVHVIGVGPGLTPLGDDVLFGHILAMRALNQLLPYHHVVKANLHRTIDLSAQMIIDALAGNYSQQLRDFIEGFFITKTLVKTQEILDYGATSGGGIIRGFVYGIKGVMNNERT